MHAVWPIVLMLVTGPSGDRPAVAPLVRVRAAANAVTLLSEAAARSAIVRELMARLQATDVIVYVEVTPSPEVTLARTMLVTATSTTRFLRIGLRSVLPPGDVTPLIAHELQHAVEIAERPEVRTGEDVRRLYQRIGRQHGIDRFETDAAREAEQLTRAEIRQRIR